MPVTNTGVINSPRSQNLCNTWNVSISIPFIAGTSRRNTLSSYSHPNRVTSWPEAWDAAVGQAPHLLHPTGTPTTQAQLLGSHPAHLRMSCQHHRARGTNKWASPPGMNTGIPEACGYINVLHENHPREHPFSLLAHLVCSTDVPFPNAACRTTSGPDERKLCQKGFWNVTLRHSIIVTICVIGAPWSLRHSRRSHCCKCCTSVETSQTGRQAYFS